MSSLIETLCALFQCKPLKLREILKHPHKREQVRQYFEGKTFRTTYLEHNHNIKFGNLTIQGADKLFAYEGYLGVTVQQHFYCRHRIRVCHACLPCVVVYGNKGHKSFYPLELISMEEKEGSFWQL
ncbi:hypothetical protein Ddc_21847 [Ditylenchus destructor]|nr:hypothetical protein Ddc_21847 [Ditylenchus destructor]